MNDFAIWLMPSGDVRVKLANVIMTLARELAAPAFEPHVTLLGGIRGDVSQMVEGCKQCALTLSPFIIQLTEVDHLQDYYRCLFIRVATSAALMHAHDSAKTIFGLGNDPPYGPHLSLLYGEYPPAVRQHISQQWVHEIALTFSAESLHLVELTGEPPNWKIVMNFPFGKK